MIRKFNYTSRRKICQRDVLIKRTDTVPSTISVSFNIEEYASEFPPEAMVLVEAQHRTTYKRFSFGTVGDFSPPEDADLAEFTSQQLKDLHFRLKVVDTGEHHGRLLGIARGIPFTSDDNEAHRRSILGVACKDLGDQLWTLDLEEDPDRPWLLLNERITAREPMEIAENDTHFFVLVYPQVVRQILTGVLIHAAEDYEDSDTGDEWQHLWILFGKDLIGSDEDLPERNDADARRDWIEDCVQAFCRIRDVRERYRDALNEV